MSLTQLHSIPASENAGPCAVTGRLADPGLRGYVVGYGGFRSACGAVLPHLVLPLNLVTVIIEFDGTARVVTGPRTLPALFDRTVWGGDGVSIGLTPAGATALLGTRMRDLAHTDVPLTDLIGRRRDDELAERLHAAPDWQTRFAILDQQLTDRLRADDRRRLDDGTSHAWSRLQRSEDRPRIAALAGELGISRRTLELRFQRHVGLSPASVARVARFQRALGMLAKRGHLASIALDCGYADQSHFTREIRALSGLTPTRLCAFLQYRESAAR